MTAFPITWWVLLAGGIVGVLVIVGVLALLLTGRKQERPRDRD